MRTAAFDALRALKDDDDAMRLVTRALTLAHVVPRHESYYLIDADRIKRKDRPPFRDALIAAAQNAIQEHIGEAADEIAWREEQPVDALVAKLLAQLPHDQATVARGQRSLLNRYAEQLRIEAASNVVTLPKKDWQ